LVIVRSFYIPILLPYDCCTLLCSYTSLDIDKEKSKRVLYELKNPTIIKRKRPGESRRSRLARGKVRVAKEMKQQKEQALRCFRTKQQRRTVPKPKEAPLFIGRYLLGKGPKYVPVRGISGSNYSKVPRATPRSHNHRRKAFIANEKQRRYYKNKSSSSCCNYRSEIYNFAILFSSSPVKFGVSLCALTAPSLGLERTDHKINKKPLSGSDIARLAYRRSLIEHRLCKILYRHPREGTIGTACFFISSYSLV